MIANVTKLYLLELYTWKTLVGFMAVLLLTPVVVKLTEKIFDWWYWRKHDRKVLEARDKFENKRT